MAKLPQVYKKFREANHIFLLGSCTQGFISAPIPFISKNEGLLCAIYTSSSQFVIQAKSFFCFAYLQLFIAWKNPGFISKRSGNVSVHD